MFSKIINGKKSKNKKKFDYFLRFCININPIMEIVIIIKKELPNGILGEGSTGLSS